MTKTATIRLTANAASESESHVARDTAGDHRDEGDGYAACQRASASATSNSALRDKTHHTGQKCFFADFCHGHLSEPSPNRRSGDYRVAFFF